MTPKSWTVLKINSVPFCKILKACDFLFLNGIFVGQVGQVGQVRLVRHQARQEPNAGEQSLCFCDINQKKSADLLANDLFAMYCM